jgi:hypothetical protein
MQLAGVIISGAFRAVRERPATFAIWFLIYLVATIAVGLVSRSMVGSIMNGGVPPGDLFLRMIPLQILMLLLALVMFNATQ